MPENNLTPATRTRLPKPVPTQPSEKGAHRERKVLAAKTTIGSISPAIYYVDKPASEDDCLHAAALGFNAVGVPELSEVQLRQIIQAANNAGISVIVDLDLTISSQTSDGAGGQLTRFTQLAEDRRFDDSLKDNLIFGSLNAKIGSLQEIGIRGFRCVNPTAVLSSVWKHLIDNARKRTPELIFCGWTVGLSVAESRKLSNAGFDFSISSSCWWNYKAGWLNDDADRLSEVAPSIALVTPPNESWSSESALRLRALKLGAFYGAGWLVPAGFEDCAGIDLSPDIILLNKLRHENAVLRSAPSAKVISSADATPAILRRGGGFVFVVNPSATTSTKFQNRAVAGRLPGRPMDLSNGNAIDEEVLLAPAECHIFSLTAEPFILRDGEVVLDCDAPRLAIEAISPKVDDGRFPVRRITGDTITIEADLIADGHDKIAGEILWRALDEAEWHHAPMTLIANDRWRGNFTLSRIGRYVYRVTTWKDFYASFVDEITKKHQAGLSIHLELQEGMLHLQEASEATRDQTQGRLAEILEMLKHANDHARLTALLSQDVINLMKAADPRSFFVESGEILVDAEPLLSRFASWYEVFPRSQSGDGARHGTFADVIKQLPRIAEMGFDVLYFPPIHPIGRVNRKGKNNTLTPAADDPGSPYAIGSADGGHDAIHPELGNIDDFVSLVKAAARSDINIALDFAVQCAPDHPWLSEHKDWFDWRPDGSLRYAENPPKKYEDIVNVDFYAEGAKPSLWLALRDIVRFWVDLGVRFFRVDNPHTKPFPFWEWLIDDIRSRQPDVVFLAEAFTRPKIMDRLAKIGFSQSYTYFTWRNTKIEIAEYLEELNELPQRDFFGPHFFVNTPDINPLFLQHSGRAGFLIRAALASTLSGLWGLYNGFELCEATPFAPGKEEYLDSEKYQIRAWDYNQPNNIISEITKLNSIRRSNAALQTHLGIKFHTAYDDDVLLFSKVASDGNTILAAICLDPFNAHEFTIEVPLWLFGLSDEATLSATDLMRDYEFTWQGKFQSVILHPGSPFCIWRIRPEGE
jgi:starch synthase (maltosyl-transferring)